MKYKAGDKVVIDDGDHMGKRGVIVSVDPGRDLPNYVRVSDPVVRHLWYAGNEITPTAALVKFTETVNHPSHYTWLPNGQDDGKPWGTAYARATGETI